jgi:hypothetical protein
VVSGTYTASCVTWVLISTDELGDGCLGERLRTRRLEGILRAGVGSDPWAVLFSQATTDSYADEQKVERKAYPKIMPLDVLFRPAYIGTVIGSLCG